MGRHKACPHTTHLSHSTALTTACFPNSLCGGAGLQNQLVMKRMLRDALVAFGCILSLPGDLVEEMGVVVVG